jgi:hypothetical protein
MCLPAPPGCEPSALAEHVRHRRVPVRVFGDTLIVARPSDGASVEMASTAARVWRLLDDWTTPAGIDRRLAEAFPEVAEADRVAARTEILRLLWDDDLLERR